MKSNSPMSNYMSIDIYDYPKYEQIDINILIELLEYKNTNYSIYSYALLKKLLNILMMN